MKIIIECEPKEIAELLQERHKIKDLNKFAQDIMNLIYLPNTESSTVNEKEIHVAV